MQFIDLFFPKRCVGCGRVGKYFCSHCSSIIRTIKPNEAVCPVCEKLAIDGQTHPRCKTRVSLDGLTSFFRYEGSVKKAVHELKYKCVYDLVYEFVSAVPEIYIQQLRECIGSQWTSYNQKIAGEQVCVLIPIPLHEQRLRLRGFNQSEKLGSVVGKRLEISVISHMLKRTRASLPQVSMHNKEDRLRNMHGVFNLQTSGKRQITSNRIVLFDDVFTTGATMREAGKVLKKSGAIWVWAVTMAR